MPANKFEHSADSLTAPAQDCFEIDPDDGSDLTVYTKAIYVGITGDVTLRPIRGETDVTFRNVPAGSILDVRVKAVRASGTTAGNIIGLA